MNICKVNFDAKYMKIPKTLGQNISLVWNDHSWWLKRLFSLYLINLAKSVSSLAETGEDQASHRVQQSSKIISQWLILKY